MTSAWLKAAAIAQRRVTSAVHTWPCQHVSGQTLETRHMQCAGQVSKLAVRTNNPMVRYPVHVRLPHARGLWVTLLHGSLVEGGQ